MATRLTVKVKNNSDKGVFRGGRFFPPLKTTTVIVSKYQLAEIKAHTDLAVVSLRDNTQVEVEEPNTNHSVEPDVPEFACPYCENYVGKSKQGLRAHIRQTHEEMYEEFKERG